MSQKNLSKKVAYKARLQNWTDNELEGFTKILADDEMRWQFHYKNMR